MLQVCKDIKCEQVSVLSADLIVALLRLLDRLVLLILVYIEGSSAAALSRTIRLLDDTICIAQRYSSPHLDIIVASDFNRHDQLQGGDRMLPTRQGKADPIIDFINRQSLESLLPYRTKTQQNAIHATIIDLMLASQELALDVLKCKIYNTEHRSDHRVIKTSFDIEVLDYAT